MTNDELALRSSIGLFVFVPPGVNERLIEQAGFRLVRQEDVTDNAALVSGRWHGPGGSQGRTCSGSRARSVSKACSGSSRRCTPDEPETSVESGVRRGKRG